MQNAKRKKEGGGGGKPNKKRFINRPPPSGAKTGIPLGSRGILISCINSKEQQAGREASALFTEIYEQLGGTWKPEAAGGDAAGTGGGGGDAPPTDIAAALASEVAELKQGSRQPFYYQLAGISSVVYLECKDAEGPSPSALVGAACEAAERTQQSRTRFCSRFYPLEQTCYASMEKINELAEKLVAQHFPADAPQPIQFAVQYDARAAPQLDRMEVINAFANRVPAPHKVNLGAPQKTILVNIVRSTCGVAVVERFKELCRYNIQQLVLPPEEREAQRAAQRGQQPDAGAAQQVQEGEEKVEQQQEQGREGEEGTAGEQQQATETAAAEEGQQQQQEPAAQAT